MRTTRVFKSGNSQAVRLPADFQLKTNVVEIFRQGDDIVIREKPKNLSAAIDLLSQLPDDMFVDERRDDPPQERDF